MGSKNKSILGKQKEKKVKCMHKLLSIAHLEFHLLENKDGLGFNCFI
jgi:hypothetical protein